MDWREKNIENAKQLPIETRQKFLDLMWKGKNIGDAAKECDISSDTAFGIMDINLENKTILRTVSK